MPVEASIIIPAKNEAANIGRCLDAVFGQKTRYSFEVIVIDSGSVDGTPEIALRRPVKIIRIAPSEFDHGATRNMGFEHSIGKFLVALVADAAPADDRWLDELIAPLEADPDIAGAYSRQIPPPDLHPLAGERFAGLDPSRLIPETRSWQGEEIWGKMGPMEKLKLVEFDDVSSVRRRSVWEKIPVAKNYWAEDVDWSLKCLRAGFKIAYAPRSIVIHGHKPSLRHDFKRAFVDQREASQRFGITLYANRREAFDSWIGAIRRDFGAASKSGLSSRSKILSIAASPLRRFLEVFGGYLGIKSLDDDIIDRDLFAGFLFTRRCGDIRKTVFTLGGKRCSAIFAHPPSTWSFDVTPRTGSALKFSAGMHPDSHELAAPTRFFVLIDGKEIYRIELDPRTRIEDRGWRPAAIDLTPWIGKKIKISMITQADNFAHAWAGWGTPRITAQTPSPVHSIKTIIVKMIEKILTSTPPRHP